MALNEGSKTGAAAVAQEFVITRTYDAPRELVYRAWTETEHLVHWWGPKELTMLSAQNDLRPGGTFLYNMRSPDGTSEMWGKWVYREIVPPERIVWVNSFSDPDGNVTRAPFAPEFPLEVLCTVTFAEHDGKTTVTVRTIPIDAPAAEQRTFNELHASMRGGWGGTLDQLAAHLDTL